VAIFQEGSAERPDPPLDFATEDLLREAAHTADVFLVEEVLGPLDRVLLWTTLPPETTETTLTPTEGFLLSRIDGVLTAGEVLDLVPSDPDASRRSLFGLLVTGLARFSPPPQEAPPAAPPPAAPPVELPRASSLAEAARQVAHERALRERRESIAETHARVVGLPNHFEVLGLNREASEAEVKAAYFRLAKQFHPDALGELQDLHEQVQAIFSRLAAAFEILGHPKGRADYEQSLPRIPSLPAMPGPSPRTTATSAGAELGVRPRRPPPSVQGAPLAPVPERSAEDLAWLAEEALKRCEALLGEGKFWEGIQVLEPHVGALAGRARHRGRLVLAQAYLHNPKWLHRGEELLRAVVRDDPMNAEAYYLLGTIYKTGGLPTRAAAMFRKALEARPGHRPAADELALLEKAPPPPRRWFRGGDES
jgi:tetratricopeptide (TPR) repeat protein